MNSTQIFHRGSAATSQYLGRKVCEHLATHASGVDHLPFRHVYPLVDTTTIYTRRNQSNNVIQLVSNGTHQRLRAKPANSQTLPKSGGLCKHQVPTCPITHMHTCVLKICVMISAGLPVVDSRSISGLSIWCGKSRGPATLILLGSPVLGQFRACPSLVSCRNNLVQLSTFVLSWRQRGLSILLLRAREVFSHPSHVVSLMLYWQFTSYGIRLSIAYLTYGFVDSFLSTVNGRIDRCWRGVK